MAGFLPGKKQKRQRLSIDGWKVVIFDPRYGTREVILKTHQELQEQKEYLDTEGMMYRVTPYTERSPSEPETRIEGRSGVTVAPGHRAEQMRQARVATDHAVMHAIERGDDTWKALHAYFPEKQWGRLREVLARHGITPIAASPERGLRAPAPRGTCGAANSGADVRPQTPSASPRNKRYEGPMVPLSEEFLGAGRFYAGDKPITSKILSTIGRWTRGVEKLTGRRSPAMRSPIRKGESKKRWPELSGGYDRDALYMEKSYEELAATLRKVHDAAKEVYDLLADKGDRAHFFQMKAKSIASTAYTLLQQEIHRESILQNVSGLKKLPHHAPFLRARDLLKRHGELLVRAEEIRKVFSPATRGDAPQVLAAAVATLAMTTPTSSSPRARGSRQQTRSDLRRHADETFAVVKRYGGITRAFLPHARRMQLEAWRARKSPATAGKNIWLAARKQGCAIAFGKIA